MYVYILQTIKIVTQSQWQDQRKVAKSEWENVNMQI